jgi:hypothetical protein
VTEEEWLVSPDAELLFCEVKARGLLNNRKARLLACGCYRLIWDRIGCMTVREAVEHAEGRADRRVTQHELERYRHPAKLASPNTLDFSLQVSLSSLVAKTCNVGYIAWQIRGASDDRRTADHRPGPESQRQADLVRDVVGNPFHTVSFDPAWRTTTAVGLAEQMYESRDFSAMPILADALEDAGCDDAEVLAHCRGDGQHVRGCWVVDLVLGKA